MVLDPRTKKYLKIFAVIALVFIFTGCTSNVDKNGQLLASRAITESTPWTLKAGIFDFLLTIPIAKGILLITSWTGNVLWGVILMTILINLIILPVMIKSTISTQKMQMLQPEMERIQNKYRGKNDQTSQMRMQNEIMNLYKKNNVSMFGSLWTFLTLPIMLAIYGAVQRIQILYTSQAFGMNLGLTPLSQITSGKFIYIVVILVMALSQFFAIEINNLMLKRNKKYKPSAQQNQMKTMNIVMTLMIIYFGLIMPTAMSFYWITTNLITVVRTVFIQIQYIEKQENQKDTHVIR